jgi:TRAP-type transport system small permease protein
VTFLTALSGGLVRLERWASRALVTVFVGLIVTNVSMRYLAGRPMVYAEELAAILLVWLTLVAVSISIHDKAQIGVSLVADLLPATAKRWLDLFIWVLIGAMLALLLQAGIGWVRSPAVGFEQVITTGWPKWPFFLIFPIFCFTALTHVLGHLSVAVVALKEAGK